MRRATHTHAAKASADGARGNRDQHDAFTPATIQPQQCCAPVEIAVRLCLLVVRMVHLPRVRLGCASSFSLRPLLLPPLRDVPQSPSCTANGSAMRSSTQSHRRSGHRQHGTHGVHTNEEAGFSAADPLDASLCVVRSARPMTTVVSSTGDAVSVPGTTTVVQPTVVEKVRVIKVRSRNSSEHTHERREERKERERGHAGRMATCSRHATAMCASSC